MNLSHLFDNRLVTNNCSKYDTSQQNENIDFLLKLTDNLLLIYPWIMIIFGTISNSISFIVLTRPKLKKSSTFFYLSCLCIIDCTLLYTFCINFIFFYQFNIDLQLTHVVICKLFSFLIYFLPQFSAWTCALVSLDRVIGVIFSVRGRYAVSAKKWNTPNTAFKVVAFLFILLFLLNAQFFFYPNEHVFSNDTNIPDVNVIYCSPENIPRYQKFYNNFWVYIDLSVNVLIPFAIMIASSIIIVIGVFNSTKNINASRTNSMALLRNRSLSLSYTGTVTHNSNPKELTPMNSQVKFTPSKRQLNNQMSDTSIQLPVFRKRASSTVTQASSSKARNISSMLATNNIVFISLTLPIVLFLSLAPAFNDPSICDYDKAKLRLLKVICIILMNANCSINIFIYSFMASEFRRQLKILIREYIFCDKQTSDLFTNRRTTFRQSKRISGNSYKNNQDSISTGNRNNSS